MQVAIDRDSLDAIKNKDAEYIYLFDNEKLDELAKLNLHCLYYKNCESVDINLTNYDIDCQKKAKLTDKDWYVIPPLINYKIGIIIPNCNYSHTLKDCLSSLAKQTYRNFEIIFVDDVSTDESVEIAKTFREQLYPEVELKIIELKQKRLNGGARNEAYLHLSDDVDYVYYVDSDDWLYSDDALEKINKKLQKNPDVLFVGMASFKNGIYKVCYIPNYKDKYEAMQGWSGSCGKVIKKSLATRQDCLYNEGTLKEDRNQHYRICINMNSFDLLKEPIYVWNRNNTKSVTTIRDDINWGTSTIRHYADTLQLYLTFKGQDSKLDQILENRVEKTKKEMLNGGDQQW